jgi:hypothetical protein
MISARAGVILTAALCLAACASTPKPAPESWTGGDPARLGADQAACRTEAANLDVSDANNYSDPRYGVASAMAEAVARDNPLANRDSIVRQAAYQTCMNDKGWRSPQ